MLLPKDLVSAVSIATWIVFCATASFSSTISDDLLMSLQRETINEFKVQLLHTLEGAKIRRKRQVGSLATLSDSGGFTAEHFRVGSSAPEDLSQYNLTTWRSFRHFGRDHILLGTTQGDLVMLDITDREKLEVVAYSLNEILIKKARAFSYHDEQWFIVQSAGAHSIIQLYQRVGRGLEQRQAIPMPGDFDFELTDIHDAHYLVAAVYRTRTNEGFTYHGNVLLYHWTNTQFDFLVSKTVQGARSVVCWSMERTLYIAVGQEINDQFNMFLGSPIFLFNAKDGARLMLQDRLQTKGPTKIAQFSVGGSNYLIFIGHFDAEIYWWSNDQFLLWQTIFGSTNANDVSVLALANGEVVLVIALVEEVLFLTLDSTGHYAVSFTMMFSGFSIKSLQFMFDGRDYYALVLFMASIRTHPHPIWKLRLDKYGLPDLTAIDPLVQCLNDLKERSSARKYELEALQEDLSRVWVTNKEQIIQTEIIVQGSISLGQNVLVDKILISSNVTDNSTLKGISSDILDIKETANFVNEGLANVMYKTREQKISGTKFFSSTISLPTLNVYSPDFDLTINGITASELSTNTLKKSGNQIIHGNIKLDQTLTDEVATDSLNNVDLKDLVLLNGSNNITGALSFSNVQGTHVEVETLNAVKVPNFVLKTGDQTVTELKSMKSLSSPSISVMEQTNGEYLKTLQQKVFDLDDYQELNGHYDFKNLVSVNKDMFVVGAVNGDVDLEKMNLEAVRINGAQELKGHKIFSSAIVLENAEVGGLINNVDLSDLATFSTEQTFTGNVTMTSATVRDHIFTDVLNDVDLYMDTVKRKSDTEFLNDMKSFQFLSANNVEVLDLVKINDVDISELAASVIKHENGTVKSEQSVFQDVVVLGDLTAHSGINGHKVSDLTGTVWLKSENQEIDAAVTIPNPVFHEINLEIGNINEVNFNEGFVHLSGDEVLQSEVVFTQHVHVIKNLSIVDGKMFDSLDLASYREEVVSGDLMSEGSIYGSKRFRDLEIKGHIGIGSINSLNIASDFIMASGKQKIDGTKIFTSVIIVDGDITAKDIDVYQFNGADLKSTFNGAVLKNNTHERTLVNKTFMYLKASDLSLTSDGKVDGVSMSEMLLRAVTLNTAQFVPASKTHESLHFAKPTIVAVFNGINLDDYTSKIVFADDVMNITGKKTFKNLVSAMNVEVKGNVNGIDVSALGQNVFSKSKNNYIDSFIFLGELDIGALQMHGSALIDDILLNSTTNLFAHPTWLLSDVKIDGDIFVAGLTNYCDLAAVTSYALRTNSETAQVIMAGTFLNTLKIKGNVFFQNTLNRLSLETLKESLIGSGKYNSLTGDFHIQSGISALHVQVNGSLNDLDLPFVINDAMVDSVFQTISGFKVFKQDLEVEVLIAKDGVSIQDTLNNVRMQDLLENTVWKTGFQVLEGDKILTHVNAKNVTVYGVINGIKFPQDVIMTAVSEQISSSVIMTKNMHIQSHLHVEGNIAGVNMNKMLENVIWLHSDVDVLPHLIFTHDVVIKGELNIDGMFNDIILEMAARTKENTEIDGLKSVLNDFIVLGNLDAHSINRYDIRQLSDIVAKRNANETIRNTQIFTQPIYSQNSISTSFINGLHVPDVTRSFLEKSRGIVATITFLDQLSKANDQQLANQLELLPSQITNFAYFVAFQELGIGNLNGLLTGFQHRTNTKQYWRSFVAWSRERNCKQKEYCCDLEYSFWLTTSQDGLLSIESGPKNGRFFPLPDPMVMSNQLVVWTNTTSLWSTRCHLGLEETVIGRLDANGLLEASYTAKNSPSLVNVKAFRDGFIYIVASYHYDSRNGEYSASMVYRGNEFKGSWSEHQILPVYGSLCMDLTTYKNEVLVAFGTGMGTYPDSYSPIYMWNAKNRMFDLVQNVPSQYATSVLWIHQGQNLLLAIAGVEHFESVTDLLCSRIAGDGQINVYLYMKGLSWIQSLRLSGVISMVSVEIEGETYLIAASEASQSVTIFQWQGYSGFVSLQTIESKGVSHLNYFWRNEDLYLTVSSSSGASRILKAVIRGRRFNTHEVAQPAFDDQGDEPQTSC